jgi:hypothetical protein
MGKKPYYHVQEVAHIEFMPDKRPEIGEQALIECLLLSMCDVIFHHESLLPLAACYFNPSSQLMHLEEYIKRAEEGQASSHARKSEAGFPGVRASVGLTMGIESPPANEAHVSSAQEEVVIKWMRRAEIGVDCQCKLASEQPSSRLTNSDQARARQGQVKHSWNANHLLAVERAGTIVGVLRAREVLALEAKTQKHYWLLAPIDVCPGTNVRRIAEELLKRFLEMVDAQRSPVYLETELDADIQLYAKVGFVSVDVRSGPVNRRYLSREPTSESTKSISDLSWSVLPAGP